MCGLDGGRISHSLCFPKTSLEERLGVRLYLFLLTHGSQRSYYYRVFLGLDNHCFIKWLQRSGHQGVTWAVRNFIPQKMESFYCFPSFLLLNSITYWSQLSGQIISRFYCVPLVVSQLIFGPKSFCSSQVTVCHSLRVVLSLSKGLSKCCFFTYAYFFGWFF